MPKTRAQWLKENTLTIPAVDHAEMVPRATLDLLVTAIAQENVRTMTFNARDRWEGAVVRVLNTLACLGVLDVAKVKSMNAPAATTGEAFAGAEPRRKPRKGKVA